MPKAKAPVPQVAAIIDAGVVVNVAALSTQNDYTGWVTAMEAAHDEVRLVEVAGIGWTVESDGLRPPSPYPSWTWDGTAWVAPVPKPEGNHVWDENTGSWIEAS